MRKIEIHGHRGYKGLLPENTIAGFLQAMELGVNAIELDVVVTKENQLLVSHEPYMSSHLCLQPNGKSISKEDELQFNIYEMTYEQIQLFDCGSIKQANFTEQKLGQHSKPLLKEVLHAVMNKRKKTPAFNIEIKSERQWYGEYQPDLSDYAKIIFNEMKPLTKNKVPFMIQSFDPAILNKLYSLAPEWRYGLLIEGDVSIQKFLNRLIFKPSFINPDHQLITKELIEEIHFEGLQILAWTVNDKERGEKLIELGVDGLISDYPHYFL